MYEYMDNENQIQPIDETYQRAIQFAKNKQAKFGPGLSNLYVLKTIDREGNVTSEHYGMNVMTDYGAKKFFTDGNTWPTTIYIGNGTTAFNHTTNELVMPITTIGTTLSSDTKSYAYPLYYHQDLADKTRNLITCSCRHMIGYFDYNISGITDTISIREYGIGTAYNALWTHSWVYDIEGNITSVNKHVDERLEITAYLCMSYYETLINDNWDAGLYTIITTMQRFYNRMYGSDVYSYKRYNQLCSRTFANTTTSFVNNTYTRYTNINEITMYNGTGLDQGYLNGWISWYNGFFMLEPQELDEPEGFDIYMWPYDHTQYGLERQFGSTSANHIPITQADINSVALFNHKTNKWDNTETFINNPTRNYCETSMSTAVACPIYYTNNNTVVGMYVYQNIYNTDPIIKINNDDLLTIYATDKYWDVSTWIHIVDYSKIPEEAQTAKYWITPSNTISIDFVRKSDVFRVIPDQEEYKEYKYGRASSCWGVCDNYEYGWWMHGTFISHAPTGSSQYFDGTTTTTGNSPMTYEKWLVDFRSNTYFSLGDMSVLPNPIITTRPNPLFTTATNVLNNCYRTKSDKGLICLQSLTASEANIIDLRNNNFDQILIQSKMATCIWGTNMVAYVPADDGSKVVVYDYDTNSEVCVVDLIDGVTNPPLLIGHRDHVWLTNGATYSYVIDVHDGVISACENTISISSGYNYIEMTAVDDVMIVYRFNVQDNKQVYYFRHDQPESPKTLSAFRTAINSNVSGRNIYNLRYIHGTTLVLVWSALYYYNGSQANGSYNEVVDFGLFLHDNSYWYYRYDHNGDALYTNLIPYGENVVCDFHKLEPLEYWIRHHVIGKTKTITALNNIKHITDKRWDLTFTNTSDYSGPPPGVKQ